MEICGPVERVELEPEAVSERRLTRHALQERGVALCEEIEEGMLIAVELTLESEVFMLGVAVGPRWRRRCLSGNGKRPELHGAT